MELYRLKKNKLRVISLSVLLISQSSFASTSLMASGHAGVVGQYTSNTPPMNTDYFAFRVPIGLTLEASPHDNLNLYLGLDYAYNNYPSPATLLGQTTVTASSLNANGQYTPMPFANTVNARNDTGGLAYGEKTDVPTLTTAYFTYQTPIGLVRAGRMPRHWGLGIWHNDVWTPTGGSLSTSDAIALTSDLNLFDVSVYVEKMGESVGGSSANNAATAYSFEARLKTDPADGPSSGVSREIGVSYSKFDHGQSNTSLNIMDIYGKFYLQQFFIGTEVLYPSGTTQNPNYQTLGGAPECNITQPNQGYSTTTTCNSQNISALAGLLKLKWQIKSSETSSVAVIESSQKLLGTSQRQESSVLGVWIGYASGGSNQFATANGSQYDPSSNNSISAIMMHPNIQPSFLMFNNTTPPVNGMPTGSITNTTFVRLDYTYESPNFGAFSPIFVWGKLNRTNPNYGAGQPGCVDSNGSSTSKTSQCAVNSAVALNRLPVGGNSSLGMEFDVRYRYTTQDRVDFGMDLGYWIVGNAWKVYGQGNPTGEYGARIFTGVQF